LVLEGGGIPQLQVFIGLSIKEQWNSQSSITTLQVCQNIWKNAISKTSNQYPAETWEHSFHNKLNIQTFLYLSLFQESVKRKTKINGSTIGDHEFSGLIYLDPIDDKSSISNLLTTEDKSYRIILPSLLIWTLNFQFSLGLGDYLEPFCPINEDNFEHWIAQVHKAFCNLITRNGKEEKIKVSEFFKGALGRKDVLNQILTIKPNISIANAAEEFKNSNLKEVALSDTTEHLTNLTTTNLIVINAKRAKAGDIYTPQCWYQAKSSQHISNFKPPTEKIKVGKSDDKKGSIYAEYNKVFQKEKPNHLFVFVSNKPLEDYDKIKSEELPPHTIVICNQNFKEYFRAFATSHVFIK